MKLLKKTKIKTLAALFATVLTAGCISLLGNPNVAFANEIPETANNSVIIAEDFSNGGGIFGDYVSIDNGEATWVASSSAYFFLSDSEKLSSNNYEISFDMKWIDNPGDIYFDLVGLDGSKNNNVFLHIVDGGNLQAPYWAWHESGGATVFNNSGIDHGGINDASVDMSKFVNIKLVHYEGYVEIWVNGIRRCVSHLSNFGNNNYGIRNAISEGTIRGFGFNISKANCVVIDNFEMKEAVEGVIEKTETNAIQDVHSTYEMDMAAQNLFSNNYVVEGSFTISQETSATYYPTISLMGLNGGLLDGMSKKFYGVNFQTMINGTNYEAQICAQKTGSQDWASAASGQKSFAIGDTLNYKIIINA